MVGKLVKIVEDPNSPFKRGRKLKRALFGFSIKKSVFGTKVSGEELYNTFQKIEPLASKRAFENLFGTPGGVLLPCGHYDSLNIERILCLKELWKEIWKLSEKQLTEY